MRKLITTIALLALVDTSVAIAQTAGSRNRSAPPSTNSGQQLLPDAAPVGHRQPRADQVPSEKNLMDPKDPINQENAALDRMIAAVAKYWPSHLSSSGCTQTYGASCRSPSTPGKCSRSFDRARRRPEACDASSLIAPVDFRAPIGDNVEGHLGALRLAG